MQEENMHEGNGKAVQDPKANLEIMYVHEYLLEKGYSIKEIDTLPELEAAKLLIDAHQYASLKLAELESRAGLRTKIKNASDSA
jgi:DNA-binding transcriptional MerR regulator